MNVQHLSLSHWAAAGRSRFVPSSTQNNASLQRVRETSLLPIADSTVSKDWFPHSFCLFYRLVPHISWTDFLINNCFPIYGLPTDANEFAMLNILRNVSKVQ